MNNLRIKTQFELPAVGNLPAGFRWLNSDVVTSDNATYGDLVYFILWAYFNCDIKSLSVGFATEGASAEGFRRDLIVLKDDRVIMKSQGGNGGFRPYPQSRYKYPFLLNRLTTEKWRNCEFGNLYWAL